MAIKKFDNETSRVAEAGAAAGGHATFTNFLL